MVSLPVVGVRTGPVVSLPVVGVRTGPVVRYADVDQPAPAGLHAFFLATHEDTPDIQMIKLVS